MKTIKEIRELKCPNHDRIRDNHHFTYECIGGMRPLPTTHCLRCGFTLSLHKSQK